MQVAKRSVYRQRVYQDSTGGIILVFGNDIVPPNADGSMPNLLADHDIVDTCIVTDHTPAG